MMNVRFRNGKPEDIQVALSLGLLRSDQKMVSRHTWGLLPHLLAKLAGERRVFLCTIEETRSQQLLLLGGSGFVKEEVVASGRSSTDEYLLERIFSAEARGQRAFLNVRQTTEANGRSDLRLFNFFGQPSDGFNPNDSEAPLQPSKIVEAWTFFHKGYQFKEIWAESADPLRAEIVAATGMPIVRKKRAADGTCVTRFCITRADALETPARWPHHVMLSHRPVFFFTAAQRTLLELALLDSSDREICTELRISAEALKKRWRSVYAQVQRREPGFWDGKPDNLHRRGSLLQRVRNNFAELRPYPRRQQILPVQHLAAHHFRADSSPVGV